MERPKHTNQPLGKGDCMDRETKKVAAALFVSSMLEALSPYEHDYRDLMPRYKYQRNVPEYKRKKEQGRNEKCLCGSGKKYKACCGR